MVRNNAITKPINDPVGSTSTFPTRKTSLKSSLDTAQQIVQHWVEVSLRKNLGVVLQVSEADDDVFEKCKAFQ